MANFVQLTHMVGNKRSAVYVNVDQICRIGDSIGGAAGYPTNILLTQEQIDVRETTAEVMRLINPPSDAITLPTPTPPAEKATARQDQAGQDFHGSIEARKSRTARTRLATRKSSRA